MDKLWVLVADETVGRIFKTDKYIGKLEEIQDLLHPEARLQERELAHHSKGTMKTGQGAKGHGLNQAGSLKDHHAGVFAKEVADAINSADQQHKFRYLIIIAAPKFLGLLRKQLSVAVMEKVDLEINKELSHLTGIEIRQHLEKAIANQE